MFSISIILCFVGIAVAQFPPKPEGVTVLKSKFHPNVTISFKQPGICETTPGVKSYAGYVHLPPGLLEDDGDEIQHYPINTFFWFFEARKNPSTAPLAIWLNGGPGASSMMGALQENGPCFIAADSKTTYLNPWSWNNEVNMLYIDQPTQVGFSYDIPTNSTFSPDGMGIAFQATPADFSHGPIPESNLTYRIGVSSSGKASHTANSTAQAAHALWHFAQTWFFEFPHYKPSDNRISLWSESYGGHYGPKFFAFFQEQNRRIDNGFSSKKGAHKLHLDTVGIVNGLVDMAVQGGYNIHFAYNNTYGIQLVNSTKYAEFLDQWNRPSGCLDHLRSCQAALALTTLDKKNKNLTKPCAIFEESCYEPFQNGMEYANRGFYDIAHPAADPFPPPHLHGYFTEESTLAALGVPVNFTFGSVAVGQGFESSYDMLRGGFLDDIAILLESGVKVHLVYGDRDFICNWQGGEAASLAVPWMQQETFAKAGYAPLFNREGDGKVGGLTRQVGNFSFTRVFQAGHEVPAYQPVTSYDIFIRATQGRDIPTGKVKVTDDFATVGLDDATTVRHAPPPMPSPKCYVLMPMSCTKEAWATISNGTAVVRDYFVVDEKEEEMGDL